MQVQTRFPCHSLLNVQESDFTFESGGGRGGSDTEPYHGMGRRLQGQMVPRLKGLTEANLSRRENWNDTEWMIGGVLAADPVPTSILGRLILHIPRPKVAASSAPSAARVKSYTAVFGSPRPKIDQETLLAWPMAFTRPIPPDLFCWTNTPW